MIPIKQDKFVKYNKEDIQIERGNCFAAVTASILEVPLNYVPNVEVLFDVTYTERVESDYREVDSLWIDVYHHWLHHKGYFYETATEFKIFHCVETSDLPTTIKNEEERERLKDEYYLVSGLSPRGSFRHIVIYQNGKLVHDPHPDNTGILENGKEDQEWSYTKIVKL